MTFRSFPPGSALPGFDRAVLTAQRADLHLSDAGGKNHCSLWWTLTPPVSGERPGVIGHFQAESPEHGAALLGAALGRLREAGCSLALGPMDGNTWRRYRALTERGPEPAFFMEPDNPDWWAAAFEAAGFSPLSRYTSTLVTDLTRRDPRVDRTLARLERHGISIRSLNPNTFEDDLRRIYRVSVISFSANFLYTPLPEAAFLAQYLPFREKIRPELVQIAERAGEPVGYLFAIPDFAEMSCGAPARTVVGKTLAVLPGKLTGGLGLLLTQRLHECARSLGFERVIHALQHEGNTRSRTLSAAFGTVMRHYTLFSRRTE